MSSEYTPEDMRIRNEAAGRASEIFPFDKRGRYLRDAAKRLSAGTNVTYQAALDGLHALCDMAARSMVEQEIRDRKSGDEGEVSDGD